MHGWRGQTKQAQPETATMCEPELRVFSLCLSCLMHSEVSMMTRSQSWLSSPAAAIIVLEAPAAVSSLPSLARSQPMHASAWQRFTPDSSDSRSPVYLQKQTTVWCRATLAVCIREQKHQALAKPCAWYMNIVVSKPERSNACSFQVPCEHRFVELRLFIQHCKPCLLLAKLPLLLIASHGVAWNTACTSCGQDLRSIIEGRLAGCSGFRDALHRYHSCQRMGWCSTFAHCFWQFTLLDSCADCWGSALTSVWLPQVSASRCFKQRLHNREWPRCDVYDGLGSPEGRCKSQELKIVQRRMLAESRSAAEAETWQTSIGMPPKKPVQDSSLHQVISVRKRRCQ